VARGGQPWFYYLLLFPLYEQFALIFGVLGVVWACFRRDAFTTFLAFWFVMALAIFSWAGEKMPWLFLHPLLPAILLAGTFVGHMLTNLSRGGRTALVAVLVILLLAEAHSAQALAYADGANPTEMLIYVQTSDDVPLVSNEVLGLAHRIKDTPSPLIQVDDADLQGWPFEWYFRNLPNADVAYDSDFSNPTAPILIMLGPEHDLYNASLQRRYFVSQYRWNWWFPEDYKGLTFDDGMCGTAAREVACSAGQTGTVFLKTGTPCPPTATAAGPSCSLIQTPAAINVFHALFEGSTWQHLWDWFVFRRPFGQLGARQLFFYIRKDIASQGSASGPARSGGASSAPGGYRTLPYHVTHILGATAPAPGRLLDPHGITTGPNGDLWVADSGNHRIRVFSPYGRLIQSLGAPGVGPGQFNPDQSPMDVAVGPRGRIYAADWWSDRIEEFTGSGRFIRPWGTYGSRGGYDFYGPRSVAIGRHGDIYVADTGNRQIAVFSPSGRFLFRFGGSGDAPGRFDEPSAVVAGRDGDIYVADMWNSRIQRFDPRGHFLSSWSVPSWQSGSYQESYLAVMPNGDILATDPINGRVLEFTPDGRLVGAITNPALVEPIGVAAGSNGAVYVSDAADSDVLVLEHGR